MVLWYYGIMVLWYYGIMVLWYYGIMVAKTLVSFVALEKTLQMLQTPRSLHRYVKLLDSTRFQKCKFATNHFQNNIKY
jgi:hypothetical protein